MKKVILVTGASSGMGKATAKLLIEQGYIVYCGARRVEKMSDLKELGGHVYELDVTDQKSIDKLAAEIIKKQGRLDVLINNAGYGLYGAVEDIELDDARRQFEVNIFGLAAVTKAFLPLMRKQKSGKIINISSMGGKVYTPMGAWYHATKHALEGWSDCLRLELKPFGIDVVIVEPGVIKTEFGNIAGEPILKNSGEGAYKKMAKNMAKSMNNSYRPDGLGSPVSLISNTIAKIIKKDRPKTRYVAGYLARPLMFVRKWFGDYIYDTIVTNSIK